MKFRILLIILFAITLGNFTNAQEIITVIGNSIHGLSNNGGSPVSAELSHPITVAFDKEGNWYIADGSNSRVRKVTATTGNISTIAGTGAESFNGDGIAATAANIGLPTGIAIDDSNNIYIADNYNNIIRKINAVTGIITTVAGNENAGYSGDGGPATNAMLNQPYGITLDTIGNIYIGDWFNSCVRKVNAKTGIISTIAGIGDSVNFSGDGGPATAAKLANPGGLAFDNKGNLYIADVNNNRIREVSAATGIITTVAGVNQGFSGDGGPATAADIYFPFGVTVDKKGNLFIADYENNRIREVNLSTNIITTYAGQVSGYSGDGGPANSADLNNPTGVVVDNSGNIYIGDNGNNVIREVKTSNGDIYTVAGNGTAGYSGDYTPVSSALIDDPDWVTRDDSGNIYFAEVHNSDIREIVASTGRVVMIAGNGVAGYAGDGGPATASELRGPSFVMKTKTGDIYIADYGNNMIRKIDGVTGIISRFAGNGGMGYSGDGGPATAAMFDEPNCVAIDKNGNVFVADQDNNCIREINISTGIITTVAGTPTAAAGFSGDGGPATAAKFNGASGVVFDSANNMYITDEGNNRIRKVDAVTGYISTFAGKGIAGNIGDGGMPDSAEFNNPLAIAIDKYNNLYITDQNNEKIREIRASTGIIVTAAGKGLTGFSGDGGPADSAGFYWPTCATVDDSGDIYIADTWNNRIREVVKSKCLNILTQPATITTCVNNSIAFNVTMADTNVLYQWMVISGSGNNKVINNSTYSGANGPALFINNTPYSLNGNKYYCKVTKPGCDSITTDAVALAVSNCKICSNIGTVAGSGSNGYSGDGGPATAAKLDGPGITVDSIGDIYIADGNNSRVRKVKASNGEITTVAGNGTWGYSGDGGAATAAEIGTPSDVALDKSGNLYILDQSYGYVRKVSATTGKISTVAGNGHVGYSGDGGPATKAEFNTPMGIGIDGLGNIYVADADNSVVRKITASTGIVTTFAGNGSTGYSGNGVLADSAMLSLPYCFAFDDSNNVYIGDYSNPYIRKVTVATGIITNVVGNGSHTFVDGSYGDSTGLVAGAIGMTMDKKGNIYFTGGDYVNKYSLVTKRVTTVAGNGVAGYAGDGGPSISSELYNPSKVGTDSAGNLYIDDENNYRIRQIILANCDAPCIITVNVNGKPKICHGATDTITASGGSYFVWSNGATTSSIVVSPVITSTYTVNISNGTCSKDTAFVVTVSPLPTVGLTYKGAICTGISDTIKATGGLSYAWSTGATSSTIFVSPSVTTTYTLSVSNGTCIKDTSAEVIVHVPPVAMVMGKDTICSGINDTLKASGGTSYAWSTGATSSSITVSPVSAATYTVSVSNGICSRDTSMVVNVHLNPVITVTGDSNICVGNSTYLYASGASTYEWIPATGLSATAIPNVTASPTVAITYTITGFSGSCYSSITKTVSVYPSNGFDLSGNLSVCIDTPSFSNASIQACIFNNRCLPTSGTLKLLIDTAIHISSITSDSAVRMYGDTLVWKYDSLSDISKTRCVSLNGSVDSLPAGDSVFVSMFISPMAGDSVPSNNNFTYWVKPFPHNCIGLPFDPNVKSVLPEGNIPVTQQLAYTIHFQNTGTGIAHNVVVIDTLSSYLDPTTLKVTSASSAVTTTIASGNIVKFTFDNIDLPDTAKSKTTSIGVVKFTIYPLSSDIPGNVIVNNAGIYFDSNPVVKTNHTVNIISGAPTSIQEPVQSFNVACFPNPFTSTTSIVFNTDGKHYIELDDITGRKLQSMECIGKQFELSRNGLANGVYFIRTLDEATNNSATIKLVVQ